MSLIALEIAAGVRRANPPVFCFDEKGNGLRLHNGLTSGRILAWSVGPDRSVVPPYPMDTDELPCFRLHFQHEIGEEACRRWLK